MIKTQIISRSIILLMFLLPVIGFSQEDKTGNWLMYFGTNKISDKFSIHSEVQYRNHTLTPNNIKHR